MAKIVLSVAIIVLITEVILVIGGTPYPLPFGLVERSPFNGTPAAFIAFLITSFFAFAYVLRKGSLGICGLFVMSPILLSALVWSYREIEFSSYPGVQEYGTIGDPVAEEPTKHIGLISACLIEDYLNGKSSSGVDEFKRDGGNLSLLEKTRELMPEASGWRVRRIIVRFAIDAGYQVLIRADSGRDSESLGLYALYWENPNTLYVEQCLFRRSSEAFVSAKWYSNRPNYWITQYGLFRAWEGFWFRVFALYCCFSYSLFGILRIISTTFAKRIHSAETFTKG